MVCTNKSFHIGLKAVLKNVMGWKTRKKKSELKMLALAFAKKRDLVLSTPTHSLAREITAFGI